MLTEFGLGQFPSVSEIALDIRLPFLNRLMQSANLGIAEHSLIFENFLSRVYPVVSNILAVYSLS